MIDKAQAQEFIKLIENASSILIVQADNPDGDSLASSLALEEILADSGKKVQLICGIDMPSHLRYLEGWSRVNKEIIADFNLSIIVDANSLELLDSLRASGQLKRLMAKPCVVLDHHIESGGIEFASLTINPPLVSTGELIFELANIAKLPISQQAMEVIAVSIMSDSLGLTTEATTASTFLTMSKLVAGGVSIPKLEDARRLMSKKEPEILSYKAELIKRIEYHYDNSIAVVVVPWEEISRYSQSYNPAMLVIDEMRSVVNNAVSIVLKCYQQGKITGKIRCNNGFPIASDLAAHFGGGGHKYASGFKLNSAKLEDLKPELVATAQKLIAKLTEAEGSQ
jgi:bifunctional oligoribonuclease and PAP phosphatase NrnA